MKNRMMKRILIFVVMLSFSMASWAQVFILDDEFEGTLREGQSSSELLVPIQGQQVDQYAPLGEGALLLGCLGGAYLLSKRRRKIE
jgi:hypothetical protein